MNYNTNILYLLLFFVLFGCANTGLHWERDKTSQEQWDIDRITCKSRAENLVEKSVRVKSYTDSLGRNALLSGFNAQMSAYSVKKEQHMYFEQCLKKLGYSPKNLK